MGFDDNMNQNMSISINMGLLEEIQSGPKASDEGVSTQMLVFLVMLIPLTLCLSVMAKAFKKKKEEKRLVAEPLVHNR
jgi:glycopeptide antibiotics resistance protein